MKTILQIVNKVLRRLRETEVGSLGETDYSLLIADFLADVHTECLKHDWSSMEHVINVDVPPGIRTFDLTRTVPNGGNVDIDDRTTTHQSLLRWQHGFPMAWIFDHVSTDPDGDQMILIPEEDMERLHQQDRDETSDIAYFSLRLSPDRDGLEMKTWPACPENQHIRLRFWTPEAEIDTDTDESRVLLVPDRVLYLGTLYLALNERGEELGEPGHVAERRYIDAMEQAVEADQNIRSFTNRFESWRE
jgi:hypothetical protein